MRPQVHLPEAFTSKATQDKFSCLYRKIYAVEGIQIALQSAY